MVTLTGIEVVGDERKAVDIRLSVYIAVHSAIRSIGHLSDLLKCIGQGSQLENLKLHRTKCSKLIANVIAPAMLTQLVQEVGDSGFSLILDESTDISTTKLLAIMIKYYSKSRKQMCTEFLGILEVYRATAAALFQGVIEYLTVIGINWRKCIGLGTDGANTPCGRHNSVQGRGEVTSEIKTSDHLFHFRYL